MSNEFPIIDKNSWFYKNCKKQRKAEAKICQCCPFKSGIEKQESVKEEETTGICPNCGGVMSIVTGCIFCRCNPPKHKEKDYWNDAITAAKRYVYLKGDVYIPPDLEDKIEIYVKPNGAVAIRSKKHPVNDGRKVTNDKP